MLWRFDYEATDRRLWPSHWGSVAVAASCYREAFNTAFAMVYGRRGVQMVTRLDLVL